MATRKLKAVEKLEPDDPGEESGSAEEMDSAAHRTGAGDTLAAKEDSGGESPTS
jgi:hypothetical protein